MKFDLGNLAGKELFAHLHANKNEMMEAKKAMVMKFSDTVVIGNPSAGNKIFEGRSTVKYLYDNNEDAGILKRTIVANTYYWLDAHDDVHLKGLFSKSIEERGKRIPHLHDHEFKLSAKVGKPLSFSEQAIDWKSVGADVDGSTFALIMESEIMKTYNPKVYDEYKNDQIDQHSVGMQYVKLALALNTDEYEEEWKVWQAVHPLLGNKATADKQGYFWAISEAKLAEVSAVLLGSNELTPTLNNKFQPAPATDKSKPTQVTLNADDLLKAYFKG